MNGRSRLSEIKSYYEDRYTPDDMGPSRRSAHTFDVFLDWLGIEANARLLDVACGTGGLLKRANRRMLDTWGIDLSERAVHVARVAHGSSFALGDMQQLPFPDRHFDYVTNVGGLEHVPDMNQALFEMARVCTSNGKLCIVVPNADFFWYKVLRREGTQQAEMEEHLQTLADWTTTLQDAGLNILKIRPDPGPDIRTEFGVQVFLRGVLRRLALAATDILPLAATYQFVFICDKRNSAVSQ